jgi:hypothetical protein
MAKKGEVYKFLSPVGKQKTVDTHPLSPRLDTLDGKTIGCHESLVGASN